MQMKKKDTVVVFVWKVSIRRWKRHKFNMDEEEYLFTEVNVMDLVKVSEEETLLKSTSDVDKTKDKQNDNDVDDSNDTSVSGINEQENSEQKKNKKQTNVEVVSIVRT
mmetsp:Transcript_25872/g.32951  ORF Transcript_25872/g.32951 Transcript_25872/m.32951 type:complete len:108 (-) Transcript_25872:1385-1708(-)